MGHMENGAHGAIVYRGYSLHGPWGTWAMGYGPHGQCGHREKWSTGGVGHMASEAHKGKGVQGVWGYIGHRDTGGNGGTGGMGHGQ